MYDALHCTAMLPIAYVAKAYVKYGDRALAFFGGDIVTCPTRNRQEAFWNINLRARNICVDVETGSVHVRSPIPLPLDDWQQIPFYFACIES